MDSSRFFFRMLGAVELVDASGAPVEPLAAHPKSLALLAFIVLSCRGGPCSRDTLLAYFWPDLSVKRARHALRQALYEIRQALGKDVLQLRGRHGVTLSKSRFDVDVVNLFDALGERRLEDAVALMQGELLPGLHVKGSREFDAWLSTERETLNRRVSGALWEEARRLGVEGDLDLAVRRGRQALMYDPYNESGLRDVMSFLLEGGRSMEALRVYRAARDRVRQVGMKLSEETVALAERCRSGSQTSSSMEPRPVDARQEITGRSRRELQSAASTASEATDKATQLRGVGRVPRKRGVARARGLVVLAFVGLVASLILLVSFVVGPHEGQATRRVAAIKDGDSVIPVIVASADGAQDARATAMVVEALAMLLSTDDEAGFAVAAPSSSTDLPPAHVALLVNARNDGSDSWSAHVQGWARGRAGPVVDVRITRIGLRPLLEAAFDTLGSVAELGRRPGQWNLLPRSDAALAAFARGRQLAARGQHHAAVAAFERATRLDSNFALGWYHWALMPEGSFDAPTRRRVSPKVDALADRLPRAEATVLEAQRAFRDGQPQQAEALLRSLLARHPHNADATFQLAEVLLHYNPIRGRPLHEAMHLLEKGVELRPRRAEALYHLSQLYLLEGDTAAFDRIATRILHGSAEYQTSPIRLVKARVDGDIDGWRDALAALASDREFSIFSAAHFLAVYAEDVTAALDVLEILTSPDREPGVRSRAHVFMAELHAAGGRSSGAVREFDAAMALDAEHGASRAAYLMAVGVLPPSDPTVAALGRRIIDAPSLPASEVPAWLDVEADLRPWLGSYARAVVRLAAGDSGEARRLLARLELLGPSRGAHLLAVSLGSFLDASSAGAPLPRWDVTPTEAILSPFFSLSATRLMKGRQAINAGHAREAELWFASLLQQSIPDLALAQMALAGQALALERSGELGAAAAARNRMVQLHNLALSP